MQLAVFKMELELLASFVVRVKGVMFYNLLECAAGVGEVFLLHDLSNQYDSNYLEVRCVC